MLKMVKQSNFVWLFMYGTESTLLKIVNVLSITPTKENCPYLMYQVTVNSWPIQEICFENVSIQGPTMKKVTEVRSVIPIQKCCSSFLQIFPIKIN
jgi:hypothetical protein